MMKPIQVLKVLLGIVYSIMTPLALIPSAIGIFALLIAIKPALCHFKDDSTSTGGEIFFNVVNQLFLGLYMMHLCLTGIFISTERKTEKFTSTIQAALTLLLCFSTICFHFVVSRRAKLGCSTTLYNSKRSDDIPCKLAMGNLDTFTTPYELPAIVTGPDSALIISFAAATSESRSLQRKPHRQFQTFDVGATTRNGIVPYLDPKHDMIQFRLRIALWLEEPKTEEDQELLEFFMNHLKKVQSAVVSSVLLEKNVYIGDDRGNGITKRLT